MLLSIIVPVYNVEQYVRLCLESILCQGLDDHCFEIIIVNDGTKDHSMEMISDIIDSHSNIKVYEQPNKGLSVARNTGLSEAKGDYVLFVDSDDLLIENSLGKMFNDVCQNEPELLIAGYIKKTDEEINREETHVSKTYHSTLILEGKSTIEYLNPRDCFVWRTLYKKSFLNKHTLRFHPGIYFEDVLFTTECYLKCKKSIITDHVFYIYRQHPGSILSAIDKKKIMDFNIVIARLWEMRNLPLSSAEYKKLMNLIYRTYLIQGWYIIHNKELLAERKEITNDLKNKASNLRFYGGIKEVIVSFFYQFMPNTYLLIRSFLL